MSLFWLQQQAFTTTAGTGTAPGSPDPFATVMAAKSPTTWWRLGESSGTTATDEEAVINGTYTGTPTLGATGITGDGDTAVTLNGTTQYIALADDASWDVGTSDFSLMAAASISSWPSGDHYAMIVRGNAYGVDDYALIFNQWWTDRVTFMLAGTSYHFDIGTTVAGSGQHLYGLSADRDGNATLYRDGSLVSAVDMSGQSATDITGSRVMALGADAFTGRYYLAGTLDECALWNGTLLSASDWSDIYASRNY